MHALPANLPTDVLKGIMSDLSFKDSLAFAFTFKHEIVNPLNSNSLNPLTFHDPNLDSNFAIRNVLSCRSDKRLFYLQKLIQNQKVDIGIYDQYLLKHAAEIGDVRLVDLIIRNQNINTSFLVQKLFRAIRPAIDKNNLELVKYLFNRGLRVIDYHLIYALDKNRLDMVDFFIKKGVVISIQTWIQFIVDNRIDRIKELVKLGFTVPVDVLLEASKYNQVDMVKYLLTLNYCWTDLVYVIINLKTHVTGFGIEYKKIFRMLEKARYSARKRYSLSLKTLYKTLKV